MTEQQAKDKIKEKILAILVVENKQSLWRAVDAVYEIFHPKEKKANDE